VVLDVRFIEKLHHKIIVSANPKFVSVHADEPGQHVETASWLWFEIAET